MKAYTLQFPAAVPSSVSCESSGIMCKAHINESLLFRCLSNVKSWHLSEWSSLPLEPDPLVFRCLNSVKSLHLSE